MEPSCSVEGSVSVKKAGKYDINIRCKDKDGNASNKSVEVIVEDEKKDVPVTGTNPNKETEKSNESAKQNDNSNVPPVQAPHCSKSISWKEIFICRWLQSINCIIEM